MRTVFVTSERHPYARFRRALDRGNATDAVSAAAELPHVGLVEALEFCLLLRDDGASSSAIVRRRAAVKALPNEIPNKSLVAQV
jgi:hypothetical protein